jgi:polar amino acid transport system substrate-binding protein
VCRCAAGPVLLGLGLVLLPAHAAPAAPHDPLRVATTAIAPFVLPNAGPHAGFSIDLWNEVARRMRVESAWHRVSTHAELLEAVQKGEADVAIAAITMTAGREAIVDFSHPYFDSGLQIMVRARDDGAFPGIARAVPWSSIGQLVGVAIVVLFVLANVLWLLERRSNAQFRKPYLRAIGEGLWGAMLIIATGEHGDREAPNVAKRVAVVLMWLLGVVLIAQLTATVTSSQTVARLQSSIQGPADLPGKAIATVPGTIAAEYLRERGLPFRGVTTASDGIAMLQEGEVDAIVYDAPTLQYWLARRGQGMVAVVGPVFRPEKYAIAVAGGSALRKPINEALLALYEDGTYEQLRAKWFSREP